MEDGAGTVATLALRCDNSGAGEAVEGIVEGTDEGVVCWVGAATGSDLGGGGRGSASSGTTVKLILLN